MFCNISHILPVQVIFANRSYILQSCSVEIICSLTVNFDILFCSAVLLCRFNIPLLVPWTQVSTGQCNFAVYDPTTWNLLPIILWSPVESERECHDPNLHWTGHHIHKSSAVQLWLQHFATMTTLLTYLVPYYSPQTQCTQMREEKMKLQRIYLRWRCSLVCHSAKTNVLLL